MLWGIVFQLAIEMSTESVAFSQKVGKSIERGWDRFNNIIQQNYTFLAYLVKIVLALVHHVYVTAAVCYHFASKNSLELDWCTGVGVLILGTVVLDAWHVYRWVLRMHCWSSAICVLIQPTLLLERIISCCKQRFLFLDRVA